MNIKDNTTKGILERLKIEKQVAERQYGDAMEALEQGHMLAADNLMKANAMLKITSVHITEIEDFSHAPFETHVAELKESLIFDVMNQMASRNLMNSTSNASNMMAIHELTAKASLAKTLFVL
jgi:hypothetical protein